LGSARRELSTKWKNRLEHANVQQFLEGSAFVSGILKRHVSVRSDESMAMCANLADLSIIHHGEEAEYRALDRDGQPNLEGLLQDSGVMLADIRSKAMGDMYVDGKWDVSRLSHSVALSSALMINDTFDVKVVSIKHYNEGEEVEHSTAKPLLLLRDAVCTVAAMLTVCEA